jgi:hypothetical protein
LLYGVTMILPDQKQILHTGCNSCESIHSERDMVVSDVTGNKISCYLSAGYSERTQSFLPVHPEVEIDKE